jgi:selenocysteine lyase/cysteine desulfurase
MAHAFSADVDFVVMSFYKLFGYPTGLGALVCRNEAAALLRKHYFGGGTVEAVAADDGFHSLRKVRSCLQKDTVASTHTTNARALIGCCGAL